MDIKEYIEESKKFNSKGDYTEEQNILKKALEENPDDVELNHLLAKSYFTVKNYKEAEKYGRKASELKGGSNEKYELLGDIYNELGKYELASKNYIMGYLSDQENERLIEKLSIISFKTGKNIDQLMEESYTAEFLNMFDDDDDDLEEEELDLDGYIEAGKKYLKQGDISKAEKNFKKALELDPNNAVIIINMAIIYYHNEKYKESEEYLRKYIELKPDDKKGYLYLGKICYKCDKYDEGIENLKKVIELDPKDVDAHTTLGIIYYFKHKNDVAIEYLEKALKLDPEDELALNALGNVYIVEGEVTKAKSCLEKALELNPNNKNAREKLDMLLGKNKAGGGVIGQLLRFLLKMGIRLAIIFIIALIVYVIKH